ncbi:hypothetical protein KM043_000875 [Ampulex compressa]|nr:hypothetical protein KM043_000875 [Ampulex compressa]
MLVSVGRLPFVGLFFERSSERSERATKISFTSVSRSSSLARAPFGLSIYLDDTDGSPIFRAPRSCFFFLENEDDENANGENWLHGDRNDDDDDENGEDDRQNSELSDAGDDDDVENDDDDDDDSDDDDGDGDDDDGDDGDDDDDDDEAKRAETFIVRSTSTTRPARGGLRFEVR